MRTALHAAAVAAALLLAAPTTADTLYVNGATGNDASNARCETWDRGTCRAK